MDLVEVRWVRIGTGGKELSYELPAVVAKVEEELLF
jgi:hypothetical protein